VWVVMLEMEQCLFVCGVCLGGKACAGSGDL